MSHELRTMYAGTRLRKRLMDDTQIYVKTFQHMLVVNGIAFVLRQFMLKNIYYCLRAFFSVSRPGVSC